VPKLSIIIATAASMLCMLALFAVAADPAPQTSAQKGAKAPQGICFLHDLL
jgi:hypothetical protein